MVQGLGGCGQFTREGCFISAYDASNGEQLWRFNTVARSDEPGGNTWANLPNFLRGGGETWITGSYDPDLDLVYFGVAQAKPWVAISRGMTVHDPALYTSSTVALRPDDGLLAWHFQHVPGESLDLDEVFERVLVDLEDRKRGLQRRQARHPLEARSGDRRVPRSQGDRLPERLRPHRPRNRRGVTYRQDIIDAQFEQLVRRVPAPPAARTGTR